VRGLEVFFEGFNTLPGFNYCNRIITGSLMNCNTGLCIPVSI
jgi:hypothetical protein